ncbi:MAG TPA: hypothetical protein VIP46_08940 [Pyrinomonadaceae bacterium]
MKKLLGLTLSLASIGFVASSAEAKAATPSASAAAAVAANAAAPQWGNRNRRRNRRVRVTTQTRLVRRGRAVYRETYRIRFLPNGRTQTTLISRVRVR